MSPFHCVFLLTTLYINKFFGASMGSCFSPVVANIFMEYIERQALTTFREPPSIWPQYVDDVFCAIKLSVIDDFHNHINSISLNIKFTLELEDNSCLAFLDVQVNLTANCKFWTKFITNPPSPTVIYNSTPSVLYTKSWLLLEPCTYESTLTLKNHLNVNLILISQRNY